jgi:hypothetical protein
VFKLKILASIGEDEGCGIGPISIFFFNCLLLKGFLLWRLDVQSIFISLD